LFSLKCPKGFNRSCRSTVKAARLQLVLKGVYWLCWQFLEERRLHAPSHEQPLMTIQLSGFLRRRERQLDASAYAGRPAARRLRRNRLIFVVMGMTVSAIGEPAKNAIWRRLRAQ
jgi:hypothetical protein